MVMSTSHTAKEKGINELWGRREGAADGGPRGAPSSLASFLAVWGCGYRCRGFDQLSHAARLIGNGGSQDEGAECQAVVKSAV
ncbi:hypothetical protein GCM10023237_39380 [Streptomyces coeruleoprunus]